MFRKSFSEEKKNVNVDIINNNEDNENNENNKNKDNIIFLIVFIIYLVFSHYINNKSFIIYDEMDESYDNGNKMVTNIKDYKDLFNKKIEYIKNNRNIMNPANDSIIETIKNRINKDDINLASAFITTLLIPGNTIGYTPVTPYDNTSKKICFQLEQGATGWYWLYGTFPDTKDSFLYELTRVDILSTELRKKLGYKLGETTIYAVTLGIGNGKDYYYGNVYFEGVFTILNNMNFSIVSKDGNFSFSHSLENITIYCKNMPLINNKNKDDVILYNFSCQSINNFNMFFNQMNGCYPCEFSNNSYQSYTNLYIDMNYTTDRGVSKTVKNGSGWMDHEWGSGGISSIFYRSLITILNKGRLYKGLPPYIWLNIRLSDNLQYMIFSMFENVPKKGDVLDCNINEYRPSGIAFFSNHPKIKVKVLETIDYDGISYPTVYQVTIDGNNYILDSTKYGQTIFIDSLNTNHWGGSCDVYLNDKIVGTGFLEAQRFDGNVKCLEGNFELLNFEKSENFAFTYYNTRNTSQLILSYFILIINFFLVFFLLYQSIKLGYNFMKKSYGTVQGNIEKIVYVSLHFFFFFLILYYIYKLVVNIFHILTTKKNI